MQTLNQYLIPTAVLFHGGNPLKSARRNTQFVILIISKRSFICSRRLKSLTFHVIC